MFPGTLRGLRDLFCILEELLVFLFQSYSICKDIDGFLAFVIDLVILYLRFCFAVFFVACLPVGCAVRAKTEFYI
jgi:hypothetical protein